MSALAEHALASARAGLNVFPLVPADKVPLRKGWQRMATSDTAAVATFWRQTPDANVGIRCGNGLIVLDADSDDVVAKVRELGAAETTSVRSCRGLHFYVQGNAPCRNGVLPGLDVRGQGGFVVGAGSLHPSGAVYRWVIPPWEQEPVWVPPAVLTLLHAQRSKPRRRLSGPIPQGSRNVTLTQRAGALKRACFSDEAICAALLAENAASCRPPLPVQEVEKIARSARQWQSGPPWLTAPNAFFNDARLHPHAQLLLRLLCQHAKDDGTCSPPRDYLAKISGLSTDSVTRATRCLEEHGRVAVTRANRKANVYTVLREYARGQGSLGDGGGIERTAHGGPLVRRYQPNGGHPVGDQKAANRNGKVNQRRNHVRYPV